MNTREPLFHIEKRSTISIAKAWGIRATAIVLGLLVCALLTTIMTGKSPIDVYSAIIDGAFGTERKAWVTLQDVSIMIIIALALTPAFKMKFWNIGGEGQVLMGGLAAAACMELMPADTAAPVMLIVMFAASLLAGAVWGFVPALFKALWNTNETLSTLMMNYIATQLVAFFVIVWEVPKGSGTIGIINSDTELGWLPDIGDGISRKYLFTIILAIIITAFVYIYQKYTKHGYELTVVGESQNTANYVGIKVGKVIVRTMILSGALCGLAGLILVAGKSHTLTTTISGGQGFTAVMVSWLAKFNPIAIVATSFLIVFISNGSGQISTSCGLNESFADILTAILLFFIIGCEFFIRYRLAFNKKAEGEETK